MKIDKVEKCVNTVVSYSTIEDATSTQKVNIRKFDFEARVYFIIYNLVGV